MAKNATNKDISELEARLAECEETLRAIRSGEVDALVVYGPEGERVYTLKGAEQPYRILVESMNEGALTLTMVGMVLYSNSRFSEMVGVSLERIIGASLADFIVPEQHAEFRALVERGGGNSGRGEFRLKKSDGTLRPAILSFRPFTTDSIPGVSVVVTDITEQKQAEERLLAMQARLRSLATELTMAEEQERRRVASYLHDRIGQSLALTQFQLDAFRESLPARNLDAELDKIQNSIVQAINETRMLTVELYPPVLYELGFAAAVEWLGEQLFREYRLRVTVQTQGSYRSLENELRGMLFQAVRELLFNVVKHSGATSARVTIHRDRDIFKVTVEDDGRGFDVARLDIPAHGTGGFGLFNIRERLNSIGGDLEIVSETGRGTRATIMVPVGEKSGITPSPAAAGKRSA